MDKTSAWRVASFGARFLGLLAAVACLFPGTISAKVEAVDDGILFTYSGAAGSVSLAGSFNDWSDSAHPMTKDGETWSIKMTLEAGVHEYKFVVDEQWFADPDNSATVGEYGNSAVTVAEDGSIGEIKPTSNTSLSPKLLLGGRAIAMYRGRLDDLADRYEVERPTLNFDLDFDVRVNDDLRAHFLTKISNDAEDVEFYQTRLNFDRGSLTLDNDALFLQAWDNEGTGTWEDPMALVGAVGIYDYDYGFSQVGAWGEADLIGLSARLLYSDNSEAGSNTFPPLQREGIADKATLGKNGQFSFATPRAFSYQYLRTAALEDVIAARIGKTLELADGRSLWGSGLYRYDRGNRQGSLSLFEVDADDASGTQGNLLEYENSFEEWTGFGLEGGYRVRDGLSFHGEYLYGKSWISAFLGTEGTAELQTMDGDPPSAQIAETGGRIISGDRNYDLDTSHRFHFGADWKKGALGTDWAGSYEYQAHELTEFATDLDRTIESKTSILRASAERGWPEMGRFGLDAGLGLEWFLFDYDTDAPWETQIWFDARNFWLDHDAHKVSYDRLTLLGGQDAIFWRPELTFHLSKSRQMDVGYKAILGTEGLDKRPKYWESLFLFETALNPRWTFYFDGRLASYDAPALELDGSFFSAFAEIRYRPVKNVSLEIGWGVDPYALDVPTNEYANVGRDQFLFALGANGETAESNYRGLGTIMENAERELRDERRVQLEAILRF